MRLIIWNWDRKLMLLIIEAEDWCRKLRPKIEARTRSSKWGCKMEAENGGWTLIPRRTIEAQNWGSKWKAETSGCFVFRFSFFRFLCAVLVGWVVGWLASWLVGRFIRVFAITQIMLGWKKERKPSKHQNPRGLEKSMQQQKCIWVLHKFWWTLVGWIVLGPRVKWAKLALLTSFFFG